MPEMLRDAVIGPSSLDRDIVMQFCKGGNLRPEDRGSGVLSACQFTAWLFYVTGTRVPFSKPLLDIFNLEARWNSLGELRRAGPKKESGQ
jgi:hypothetical protein